MELISAIAIVAAGILWGTMGIFVRCLSAWGFSTLQITALRIVMGAVMYLVFLAVTDKNRLKIKWKDIPLFIGMGIGSIFLMSITYFSTMQMTSLSVAAILLYTAPIFVMIMSVIFLKEKLTVRKVTALLTAFAGCILVTGIGGNVHISTGGIAMGLLSGLSYALYSIFGSFALRKYHPYTVSAYAFSFAAAAELVLCNVPRTVETIVKAPNPVMVILISALMAFATAFLPYLFYTFGLKRVEAGKASILATVEPMTATLLGIVLYREALDALSVTGVVLILMAIVVLNNFGHCRQKT